MPTTPELGPLQTLLHVEDNLADLKLAEQIVARHCNICLLTAIKLNEFMGASGGALKLSRTAPDCAAEEKRNRHDGY